MAPGGSLGSASPSAPPPSNRSPGMAGRTLSEPFHEEVAARVAAESVHSLYQVLAARFAFVHHCPLPGRAETLPELLRCSGCPLPLSSRLS
jgi:hypothetical protein